MVRPQTLGIAAFVFMVFFVVDGVHASQSIEPVQQSKPIDRGYGQHDACFGDKYESDDDLKTGNELSIEDVLKLLNTPVT